MSDQPKPESTPMPEDFYTTAMYCLFNSEKPFDVKAFKVHNFLQFNSEQVNEYVSTFTRGDLYSKAQYAEKNGLVKEALTYLEAIINEITRLKPSFENAINRSPYPFLQNEYNQMVQEINSAYVTFSSMNSSTDDEPPITEEEETNFRSKLIFLLSVFEVSGLELPAEPNTKSSFFSKLIGASKSRTNTLLRDLGANTSKVNYEIKTKRGTELQNIKALIFELEKDGYDPKITDLMKKKLSEKKR